MSWSHMWLAACALALAMPAGAGQKFWVCGNGNWDNGSCWSLTYNGAGGAGEPIDADVAHLWQESGTNRTVTYQTSLSPVPDLATLSIDAVGSGTMTLSQASDTLSTTLAYIGFIGSGHYALSGGDLSVSDRLTVGLQDGAWGTFDLSGSGAISADSIALASATGARGTFNQSGGTVTVAGTLWWGNGGIGEYNFSGGTISTNETANAPSNTSASTFLQTGGTHTTTGNLTIANGIYTLQDGVLNVGATLDVDNTEFVQTGGSLTAETIQDGVFNLGVGAATTANTINGGDYTLNGGSLTATTATLGAPDTLTFSSGTLAIDTLNLSGGTITGDITIAGPSTLNYGSGTVDGRLTNDGTVASTAANMPMSDGMENNGTVSGNSFTFNGSGFVNNGTLQFAGSLGGDGALVNDGQLTGYGTVGGSGGFINNGQFTQGSGDVTLSNTGANTNTGTITLGFFRQLILGEGLTNNGVLTLNNSQIGGSAALAVGAAGTVSGSGNIFVDVNNAGVINAKSGNLIIDGGSFSNSGLVKNSVGSNLFVDAATIANTGNIEANAAGSVVFDAAISNGSGQTVDLKGGTLGTPTLTNAAGGTVSGFGTIAGNLVNAGSVDFFGASSVVGDVDNEGGGHLLVRNDQTLITGHTTNDGTIETLNGAVIFEGGLTNNGTLQFDPSLLTVSTLLVGMDGVLQETGPPGDEIVVTEDFINMSRQNETWDTDGTKLIFNGGFHDTADPQTYEASAADLGGVLAGFVENFVFDVLRIGTSATYVRLDDLYDNSAMSLNGLPEITTNEAVYVTNLILESGTTLDLNGLNLYYRTFTNNGGTLLGGLATAVIPEPRSIVFVMTALLGIVGYRRRSSRP